MQRKPLLWQLFPSYLVITLGSLIAVAWYASQTLSAFYTRQMAASLASIARVAERQILADLKAGNFDEIEHLCRQLGDPKATRVTVMLPSGRVIGDSEESPENMDNHGDRPEVIAALAGDEDGSVQIRYSDTLGRRMMYVAVPINTDGDVIGVLRTSVPVTLINRALMSMNIRIAVAGLVAAVVAAVLSLVVSRRISRPLQEMKRGAELFAKGDFTHQLAPGDSLEIDALADAMNKMARDLDERIRTIIRGRNEQQAVLSSMVESVIAVDTDCKCISINHAAARLIDTSVDKVQGRDLHEILRNIDLQRFVERALDSDEPIEGQIVLRDGLEQRYLHAHGTALRDGQQQRIGAVVVMNDITQLRRLERVRQDFVANVSHELKTPITAIQGFVETLIDGAINEPKDAGRFLEIIARQAGRLNAIINDLLTLSKLEERTEAMEIKLENERVKPTIEAAIGLCEVKSREKGIRIEVDCDDGLAANMNDPLLEQALVNLIDNAIKYSESGSSVQIRGEKVDNGVQISVADHGCGIEHKYLSRLFERFYRVDKARSRKLGGTGLGLAIVKHIAQAHRGRVSANSIPGKGSTFTIHLPLG